MTSVHIAVVYDVILDSFPGCSDLLDYKGHVTIRSQRWECSEKLEV